MDYNNILEKLAPCGLSCQKCFAYFKGDIKHTSKQLRKLLGSFERYADRFSEFLPIFKLYPPFRELLEYFGEGDCKGCRKGTCKYPDCGVNKCFMEKNVDFCFQCNEFPCDKTNFDPDLKKRWLYMNSRMKEIGVEAYYEETKDLPRYLKTEEWIP